MQYFRTYLAVILLSLSSFSYSATSSSNFQSNATLTSTCNFVSTGNIDFGGISPGTTGYFTKTANITYVCNKGVFYNVRLSKGNSSSYLNRVMTGTNGNTDSLSYNVYLDTNYSMILGDTTEGTYDLSATSSGNTGLISLRLRMPLNQYVKPDNYSDSLVLSITY